MALIKKANVVLDIKDSEVDRYLDMGYLLIDDDGKVIKKGEPVDLESYRRAYLEQREKIEMLEAEIEALKKSNVTKRATTRKKAEKSEESEDD